MATSKDTAAPDLREEFNALRDEVGQFIDSLKSYEKEKINSAKANLTDEVSHYHDLAKEKMQNARATGEQTVHDLEDKIRDNPLSSLAIAFAIGFLASRITRKNN